MTRQDLLDDFLRYAAGERRMSAKTVENYARDLRQFERFVVGHEGGGDWSWSEVDRTTIRSFLGSMAARGLARTTLRRRLAAVRSFYGFLRRTGRVEGDPSRSIRGPKLGRTLPEHLTVDQARSMLEQARVTAEESGSFLDLRRWALLETLYSCGLRVSEVHQLDTTHVAADRIRALGKGGKERDVPLGAAAAAALAAYLPARRKHAPDERAVFVSRKGNRLSIRQLQRDATQALKIASDGARVSTHSLRHTFATHLVDGGADLVSVKAMLGHASLSTTRVYTHTSVERLRKVHAQAHPRGGGEAEEDVHAG